MTAKGSPNRRSARDPWIAFGRPNPEARLRLFCFPYAGGGASIYREWGSDLPRDIEVCPVQLPGRENRIREEPIRRMEPLLDALSSGLDAYLDRPFALFGHSMGATIGYELARRLRAEGKNGPLVLLVAARRAPHVPPPESPIYDLPDESFKQSLRDLAGTPEGFFDDTELVQLFEPMLRADFEINDTYRPSGDLLLDCPISVFGALDDDAVPLGHLEAWREVTRGPFRLEMLPGDHFTVIGERDRLVAGVAHELRRFLAPR